jgi:DNA topoisomerase-2
LVDGLKTSQRKALEVSYQIWKNDRGDMKQMKVFQLSGKVCSEVQYHHGGASMEQAIITMSQDFKSNITYLWSDSQIGSRFVPESGAPRYVSAKLNPNIKNILKDFELLTYKYDEGFKIEPKYFLPIIPMILVNGSSGIAVGHASEILNRNPKQIISECINHLNGKNIKKMKPSYTFVKGDFVQDEVNHKKWYSRGIFEKVNTNTLRITDVPLGYTYETYDIVLEKLVSDGSIISYEDNSKENFDYVIKVSRAWLANKTDEQIIKIFKLEKPYTENFTVLDEFGKLKIFEKAEDILKHFVNFRLTFYQKRKDYQIGQIDNQINILNNKIRFIKSIIDELLVVNNRKKEVIEKDLIVLKFDKVESNFDYLLRMPIYSLTKETYDKLKEDVVSFSNRFTLPGFLN